MNDRSFGATPPRRRIGGFGAFRAGIRIAAAGLLLVGCVLGHFASLALSRRSAWPRRLLGGSAWLFGAEVRVEGTPAPAPVLLLANHVSWLDILVLAGATGTRFVAHSGVSENPVLRWLSERNGTIFIARDQRGAVRAQADRLRTALAERQPLALFAEGTTGDGTALLPFKSSLLAAVDPMPPGVSVQPVWLDYGRDASAIAWFGDEPGLANVLRVLARRERILVIVHLLAPLSGEQLASRKTIAASARGQIAAAGLRQPRRCGPTDLPHSVRR